VSVARAIAWIALFISLDLGIIIEYTHGYNCHFRLPVLDPDLSHANEPISDGGEASLKWIKLLMSENAEQRQEIISELKSYCHLDTFGMVKLLEHVKNAR
jgi:hypothetical protein